MKKLILPLILLISMTANTQIKYGYNGTNVPENLTPEVIGYLNEQVPAGETFVLCFRNDKYTAAAPDVDINNVIALRDKLAASGKGFELIYTFNARGVVSISDNFYALNKFKAAGVTIMAVRLGNEEFFKEAGHSSDWTTYINKNAALLAEIETRPDNFTVIFPIADPDWVLWNPEAAAFINAKSTRAPDVHFYFDKKAVPVIGTLVNKMLPAEKVTATYLPTKDDFYSDLYWEVVTSDFYDEVITYCKSTYPGKKIYITEYGPATGPGEIGNTLGYEAATDWFLNKTEADADIIAALCRFNGPSLTGVITPSSKNDTQVGGYIKRLGYHTISNYLKHKDATEYSAITKPGTYQFAFRNMTDQPVGIEPLFQLPDNLYIETYSFEGISGQYFYSSSGACAWWSKGSTKSYEITGTKTTTNVPAKAYGYITITIESITVYGCTDALAMNFNPEANANDGSCFYFSDCGCWDKAATNYAPDSPCQDNTKCTYAPPPPAVCYKERLIFKSLGCKIDKNCSVNNCK